MQPEPEVIIDVFGNVGYIGKLRQRWLEIKNLQKEDYQIMLQYYQLNNPNFVLK